MVLSVRPFLLTRKSKWPPSPAWSKLMESYFGQTRLRGSLQKLKRGHGTNKQPVFGIYERGGRVYTEIIPDTAKRTLQRVIRGQICWKASSSAMDGAAITGSSMWASTSICASKKDRRWDKTCQKWCPYQRHRKLLVIYKKTLGKVQRL